MKTGDLVKWTEETGEIYFGIVTCKDEHYVEISWTDGDSGYYSDFVIGKTLEKVDESR